MGEKKRHSQSSNKSPNRRSGSSESSDQGEKNSCKHIKRAVDLNLVNKKCKSTNSAEYFICNDCKKNVKVTDSLKWEELWLCLKCGGCYCGQKDKNHIDSHVTTPRSDWHMIALFLQEWAVSCLQCKVSIPEKDKKVSQILRIVKQCYDKHLRQDVSEPVIADTKVESQDLEVSASNSNYFAKNKSISLPLNLPEVRGLSNLGNTCFFNSVLQCLAQTQGLVELLREMEMPGEKFVMSVKDAEPICTELERNAGQISDALASVLVQVAGLDRTGSGDTNHVVNPRQLLTALRKKCPQFEGSDQHDAHELLRHLLDSVRMEDLRRYHKAIFHYVGLSSKESPQEMDVNKRTVAKALNQQVCDTVLIRPDHIFKGLLVSRLECQTCFHFSERVESFLDLSLPVTPEKPQPPSIAHRKLQSSDSDQSWRKSETNPKNKKAPRKWRKGYSKPQAQTSPDSQGEPTILEEEKKDLATAEPSDADVEDNEDGGCDEQEQRLDILESGYSSEKQASPRASPSTHSPGEDSDTLLTRPQGQKRSESGLGSSTVSIQELTVKIPDSPPQVNVNLASPNSTQANASPGSQEVSSDSLPNEKQFGCENRNDDISIRKYGACNNYLPSSSFNSTSIVYGWECNPFPDSKKSDSEQENVKCFSHNSNDSSSISMPNTPPGGGDSSISRSSQDVNLNSSVKENQDSRGETLVTDCSPLYPAKDFQGENQQEERPMSRLEFHETVARSSPVDQLTSPSLDTVALNMQLQYYKTEEKDETPNKVRSLLEQSDEELTKMNESSNIVENDNETNGFVLVGPVFKNEPEPSASTDTLVNNHYDETLDTVKAKQSEEIVSKPGPVTLAPRYKYEEGECSLESCLYQFTAIEIMTGNNKVACEACTARQGKAGNKDNKPVYTACTKQFLISSLPPIMIFHFKRFQVQMCSFRKIFRHVKFPLVLDIAPFCSAKCQSVTPGQAQIPYSLYGVVEHSGTLHGGHYVAYVKVTPKGNAYQQTPMEPKPGKWYYISDSRVMEVSETKVLDTEAYLLFYERLL